MSTLHTLASGSSGNALLISHGRTHILVDAGISCRRIATALAQLSLTFADISAILITHGHRDHVAGLKTISKKHTCPMYASGDTCQELAQKIPETIPHLRTFLPSSPFWVEDVQIQSFPVPHDSVGAVGYRVGDVGVLTDCGYIPQEGAEVLFGAPILVLESNHDVGMVYDGPYPYHLKQRVLGDWGHLSNETAAEFAVAAAKNGTGTIILAHLSAENNTPQTAYRTVSQALDVAGLTPLLEVAPRDQLSQPYQAVEVLCRK